MLARFITVILWLAFLLPAQGAASLALETCPIPGDAQLGKAEKSMVSLVRVDQTEVARVDAPMPRPLPPAECLLSLWLTPRPTDTSALGVDHTPPLLRCALRTRRLELRI